MRSGAWSVRRSQNSTSCDGVPSTWNCLGSICSASKAWLRADAGPTRVGRRAVGRRAAAGLCQSGVRAAQAAGYPSSIIAAMTPEV